MLVSKRHFLLSIGLLCLGGCNAKPPKPTLDECFGQLQQGQTQDEIVALMGEPHKRTDGPQVALGDRESLRGKSILMDKRVISADDPVSHEMVKLFLAGGTHYSEPTGFAAGPAVQVDPASTPVNWLYRPSLGRRRSGNAQDQSLIWLSFRDGKLIDAYRLSR